MPLLQNILFRLQISMILLQSRIPLLQNNVSLLIQRCLLLALFKRGYNMRTCSLLSALMIV